MLFDNYLNIFKLIFMRTNLDLKLVQKKKFKLVLFCSNFFFFYFIYSNYFLHTSHQFFFFPLILPTTRCHCPPLSTATGRQC